MQICTQLHETSISKCEDGALHRVAENTLLLEDLTTFSKILNKAYGYGKGTANIFSLCGVNRLYDIVDQYDDLQIKLDCEELMISERQRHICKDCLMNLSSSEVVRNFELARFIESCRTGTSFTRRKIVEVDNEYCINKQSNYKGS